MSSSASQKVIVDMSMAAEADSLLPANPAANDTKTTQARRIILSSIISRFGSRSWEFATVSVLFDLSTNFN
jgi:hypothetical protein